MKFSNLSVRIITKEHPKLKYNRFITKIASIFGYSRADYPQRLQWYDDYESKLNEIKNQYGENRDSHFIIETSPDQESKTTLNHLCIKYAQKGFKLSQEERVKTIIRLLNVLVDYLDRHHIEYWLDHGTLLGGYRNGRIIPWDEDGDISFTNDSLNKLIEVIPKYPFQDKDCLMIFRRARCNQKPPNSPSDLIPCFLVDSQNGVYVDCFLCHSINEEYFRVYWTYCYACRFDSMTIKKAMVYPLKPINLERRLYYSPNNTQKYLEIRYGNLAPRKNKC